MLCEEAEARAGVRALRAEREHLHCAGCRGACAGAWHRQEADARQVCVDMGLIYPPRESHLPSALSRCPMHLLQGLYAAKTCTWMH